MKNPDHIKITEAAKILETTPQNLRRWHEEFPPVRVTPKGTRFYSRKTLVKYMKKQEGSNVQYK